jgi:hypothetical protein
LIAVPLLPLPTGHAAGYCHRTVVVILEHATGGWTLPCYADITLPVTVVMTVVPVYCG